eukprot:CAMPEP_0194160940 /NCGR_PEP_ID=MMETSP0152-20130528/78667_1 /TAXON_ID=1049557 /ORGANISM="Thalassiothrix antarctica, Strain L6-D1" /LENGTH=140 /DNA_ID=CAMNT_0038870679 /DNA_START=79 /DNA_END=501 /DNA_ORIENTATION=+
MMNLLPRTLELRNEESTDVHKEQTASLTEWERSFHSFPSSPALTKNNCEESPTSVNIMNPTNERKLYHQVQLNDDILDELAHEVEQDISEWENTLQVWDPMAENIPFVLDELAREVEQDISEWENTLQVWDPMAENIPFD